MGIGITEELPLKEELTLTLRQFKSRSEMLTAMNY